jgi:hypothetical protein
MLQAAMTFLPGVFGPVWVPGSRHELDIESDGHLVANQNAAGLEGNVPSQTEILPL